MLEKSIHATCNLGDRGGDAVGADTKNVPGNVGRNEDIQPLVFLRCDFMGGGAKFARVNRGE